MNGDRRQNGRSWDLLILAAALASGVMALLIQVALIRITGDLMSEMNRIRGKHQHLLEHSVEALRQCREHQRN